MAYPGACSKHPCIPVPPLQTTQLLLIIISGVVLLASSMVAVAAADQQAPPGGYRFGLIHVDAHGNFTKDELIHRAAERSRRRAATMSVLAGADDDESSSTSSWMSPLHYSSISNNEYLMEMWVEGHKYRAIADTGSSLIWLRPPRQPVSSMKHDHANHQLRCTDTLCDGSMKSPECELHPDHWCSYDARYADGFRTRGPMYIETLSLQQQQQPQRHGKLPYVAPAPPPPAVYVPKDIAIGWSEDTYDGTVGLGRGKQSLVNQLGVHTLSYCLQTYDKADQGSTLLLGSSDDKALKSSCPNPKSCKVHTTSLLPHDERYYVHLDYIKIGDEYWSKEGGANNMFIDSGATFTFLERTAYDALVRHVDNAMREAKATKVVVHGSTADCWSGIAKDDTKLRLGGLELHFAGADGPAVMYLDKDKIIYDDLYDGRGRKLNHKQVCLAFHPEKEPGVSVLGNFQQHNLHMHFDTAKNKLSFVSVKDCTKV